MLFFFIYTKIYLQFIQKCVHLVNEMKGSVKLYRLREGAQQGHLTKKLRRISAKWPISFEFSSNLTSGSEAEENRFIRGLERQIRSEKKFKE